MARPGGSFEPPGLAVEPPLKVANKKKLHLWTKSSRQFGGDAVGEILRIKCYATFKLCKVGEKYYFFRMSKDRKEKESIF